MKILFILGLFFTLNLQLSYGQYCFNSEIISSYSCKLMQQGPIPSDNILIETRLMKPRLNKDQCKDKQELEATQLYPRIQGLDRFVDQPYCEYSLSLNDLIFSGDISDTHLYP